MSTWEEIYEESSEASVGEMIQRRAAMEHDGSRGRGSRDVGVQMRTHYVLDPYRHFSKVRDVGTQTRENANKVIYNPRILSNSYLEAVQQKRQDRDFSFVYDLREHDLYRIRKSRPDVDIPPEVSDSDSLSSRSPNDLSETGSSVNVEGFYKAFRGTRNVGVQMDTKYLVQESRPKSVVRDVGIQTKLPSLYAPSESEMIEKLWQNRLPLSKNVTCSLTSSWRHGSELSESEMSYMLGNETRKYGSVPERSLKVNEKLRRNDISKERGVLDRTNYLIVHKNKNENTQYRKDLIKQRSFRGKESKSKTRVKERPKSGTLSEVSTFSKSSDGQSQIEDKHRRREDRFQLTTFEYLGTEQLPARLKSENISIAMQTESECKSLKVFRKPLPRPKSEWTRDCRPLSKGKRKTSLSTSDTSVEVMYTTSRLTKEKDNVHTREHTPTPVEIVHGSHHPYRPKEDAKYSEDRSQTEKQSSTKTYFDIEDGFKSSEIGPEPDVIPAELTEKPAFKPRPPKAKVL